MYKFIISSLVISLQLSAIQTCSKSFNDQQQYANQSVEPINIERSSTIISSDNFDMGSNETVRLHNQQSERKRSVRYQQKLDDTDVQSDSNSSSDGNRSSNNSLEYISDDDLVSLRVEYYKYKILSNLDINTNPDNSAPSGYEKLAQLEANKHLISDIERTDLVQRSRNQRRGKRSLACRDVRSDQDACCVQDFYLNFTDFGWNKWILYPSGYMANYCRGKCDLSHARYHHSKLLVKYNHIIGLCCSPRRMAPLQLLYIDDNKVHQKAIPDMIVESCDCA